MRMLISALLGAGMTLAIGAQAQAAMPVQSLANPGVDVLQVFAGCGPFGHRGPFGGCRPGGQLGGYVPGRACPRGFHLGPYGRRCFPNRY